MSLITDATTGWSSPVTLTTDEIWQTRKGSVFVSTTVSPDPEDGLALHEFHAVQFPAGSAVRYRKEGPGEALVVREAI
ncbi:MAG: hypothetical protein OEY05_02460 [Paracoccaceae bacterium]|nr:hypothetical protein [Paracoccaceae bacterium]